MAEVPNNPGSKVTLDELIDRAKSAAELAALADKHPAVRAELETQARIDDSLARLFAAPVAGESRGSQKGELLRAPRSRWLPWAAAAALLLAGVGTWWFVLRASGPDVLSPAYHEVVAAGFKPEEVCTTDEAFVQWCRVYMRQPIYPTSHPDGLEFVGWSKGKIISPISGVLLVKMSGEPVIVVLERTDRQTVTPGPSADPTLHVFRKRIGEVMLYEISPKTESVVLPTLSATKG